VSPETLLVLRPEVDHEFGAGSEASRPTLASAGPSAGGAAGALYELDPDLLHRQDRG
jgi:hypothetical protein